MSKNSYTIFWLTLLAYEFIYQILSKALALNFSYLCNFSSSVPHIPQNSFPHQKSCWKVQVHMVTTQELKMYAKNQMK